MVIILFLRRWRQRYSGTTLAREFKSQRVLACSLQNRRHFSRPGSDERDLFLFFAGCSRENLAPKGFLGLSYYWKSITTQDMALSHIMRPKLQIPFKVYGIMAITGQSILTLLRLSFRVIHKHSSSGCIQKDGFQNKRQHSERSQAAKNVGFVVPGLYSSGEGWTVQGNPG